MADSQQASLVMNSGVLHGQVLQRWHRVGQVQGLVSDAEIASFLLDLYEDPPSKATASESSQLCSSCHTPLTLVCLTCNPAQTKHDTVDLQLLPASACENTSDNDCGSDRWEDDDFSGNCFVKVEDITNRKAVARLEEEGILSPVAAQTLKAARSRDRSQTTPSTTVAVQRNRVRNRSFMTKDSLVKKQRAVPTQDGEGKGEQCETSQVLENGDQDDRPFRCSVCPKTFKSRSHCRSHEVTHKGDKLHKCDVCPAAFHTPHNLRMHYRTHTGERPFFCQICHKSFARSGTLKRHKLIHRNSYPFKCEDCGAMFVEQGLLQAHCGKEHTLERPFSCSQCDASFVLKRYLSAHLLWHSSQRPFLCEECGASFKQKAVLNTHKRIHKGIRPFSCDICGQLFYRQGNLRVHRKTHLNIRDFMCTVCGAAFARNNTLKRHMQKHTGFRPFKCCECDKTFALKFDLKKHLSIHSGDKPYACDVCGRLFALMGNMKKHRKRRHKRAPPCASATLKVGSQVEGADSYLSFSQVSDQFSSENEKQEVSPCDSGTQHIESFVSDSIT